MTAPERHDHLFVCEAGDCLCETRLSITDEQYKRRFHFSESLACPVCGRGAYPVAVPDPLAKESLTVGMVTAYETGVAEGGKSEREQIIKQFDVALLCSGYQGNHDAGVGTMIIDYVKGCGPSTLIEHNLIKVIESLRRRP